LQRNNHIRLAKYFCKLRNNGGWVTEIQPESIPDIPYTANGKGKLLGNVAAVKVSVPGNQAFVPGVISRIFRRRPPEAKNPDTEEGAIR